MRAQANLLNLQDRNVYDPSLRTIESSYYDTGEYHAAYLSHSVFCSSQNIYNLLTMLIWLDSLRSGSPYDGNSQIPFKSPLPPRIKPRHQAFMDVPKCSGCIGRAIEV
jgi:hypothetical protein